MGKKEAISKKSSAKAAGLKSVFILSNDELLMTSFGRGNEAKPEKRIHNDSVENRASGLSAFAIKKGGKQDEIYKIIGRANNQGNTDNPLYRRNKGVDITKKEDMIHAKKALEKRYYGQSFEDNIHIQAIYNVLDIEKILTIHINNIIYSLNNFLRNEGDDLADLIGKLFHQVSYQHFIKKPQYKDSLTLFKKLCAARQLSYLNIGVFNAESKNTNNSSNNFSKKGNNPAIMLQEHEFYDLLRALSDMRNMLAHGIEGNSKHVYLLPCNDDGAGNNTIYTVIDKLYSERITELNNHFWNLSKNNLCILNKVLGFSSLSDKQKLVERYFNFEIRKDYKYLGVSVKKIRELFIDDQSKAGIFSNSKYDSVRSKVNKYIDFIIYDYFLDDEAFVNSFADRLRTSKDLSEKDNIYLDCANRLWRSAGFKNIINSLSKICKGTAFKNNEGFDLTGLSLDELKISKSASSFSKLIFMITLFIDGKEINDLLTTLVNKFDNINSFQKIMHECDIMPSDMVEKYDLFNYSDVIVNELKVINSFSRMHKPSPDAKKVMYIEALQILGVSDTDDEVVLAEEILEKSSRAKNKGKDTSVRNFIANNVIESNRFHYLVRYGNPKKVRELVQNKGVVHFILKDIPDSQIERYYKNVVLGNETDPKTMRHHLAELLYGFSFDSIKYVKQDDRSSSLAEKEEKNRMRALVGLYLTVLYLAVKNLVYVNSRYFLAFHCVERDRLLLDPQKWEGYEKEKNKLQFDPEFRWISFTEWFLERYPHKKRVTRYLQQNMEKSSDWAIRVFRNKVEHLDAVRNAELYLTDFPEDWEVHSWFELFHYILQRRIQSQYEFDTTHESTKFLGQMIKEPGKDDALLNNYFKLLDHYHTPVKDFTKELNTPFAYNLSRYKNLSIDDLFDRNRSGENVSLYE